jgi:hypothetical protein
MIAFLIGLSAGLISGHFAIPLLLDWIDALRYRAKQRAITDDVVARCMKDWNWTEAQARQWAKQYYR